jgi:hypothetical protein
MEWSRKTLPITLGKVAIRALGQVRQSTQHNGERMRQIHGIKILGWQIQQLKNK